MLLSVLFLLAPLLLVEGFLFGFLPVVTPKDEDRQGFNVYWNVPTFMCHKYGLRFEEVSDKFTILQNKMDEFRGNDITILYDPGMFPALLKDSNGHVVRRNGGVPQEGNLTRHLEVFRKHLTEQIPDESFRGIGVIDFESWRPIFRQNWASLQPYKDYSIELVREQHPFWDSRSVEQEAKRSFEKYGKLFVEETLKAAKEIRPKASWGYYAYPYCYNLSPHQPSPQCDRTTVLENDKMSWLFELEDVLLPSVYLRLGLTAGERVGLVGGRVKEALRVARQSTPRKKVLPYYWYKYQDQRDVYLDKVSSLGRICGTANHPPIFPSHIGAGIAQFPRYVRVDSSSASSPSPMFPLSPVGFGNMIKGMRKMRHLITRWPRRPLLKVDLSSQADLEATLRKISDLGADGLIIWGSSNDINTEKKCLRFREYLDNDLGPIVDRVRRNALGLSSYEAGPADDRGAVSVDQV